MKEYTVQQVIKVQKKRELFFHQYEQVIQKAIDLGLYDVALKHSEKREELYVGLQKLISF